MNLPLIKISAYAGLILLTLTILLSIIFVMGEAFNISTEQLINISTLNTYISIIIEIIFLNGFLILGKKYHSKLLIIMTWIGIIFFLTLFAVVMVSNILGDKMVTAQSQITTQEYTITDWDLLKLRYLKIILPITIVLGLYSILFGLGLLKISKNIKYAKTSGILNIISGLTYPIFIGFIIINISTIFEILLMFNETKKH